MTKISSRDDSNHTTYDYSMKRTLHVLVSGRVQGVGFRFFTKKSADERGLSGWVRNLSDGRVEALIQGADTDLDHINKELRSGPLLAKVTELEVREISFSQSLEGFNIEEDAATVWSENGV